MHESRVAILAVFGLKLTLGSALLPVLVGCATPEPDVVATQVPAHKDAGGGFSFTQLDTCREGRYGGIFSANDGNLASTLKGPISFQLVKQGSGEFFSVTPGEKLQGSSEQGDQFSAEIDTDTDKSGCREGKFSVQLVNGAYLPVGWTSSVPIDFTGKVQGNYVASISEGGFASDEGVFVGTWISFFGELKVASGNWSAVRFGPVRDSGAGD